MELFSNFRAIEIDPKWGKAYSRLAEVYVGQFRYMDASQEYQKAMDLVDEKQKAVYQLQREKLEKRLTTATVDSLKTISINDRKISSKWYIKAMEADIRNPKTYTSINPCPLGYLTAADKIYLAYPFFWGRGLMIDILTGKKGWRFLQKPRKCLRGYGLRIELQSQ
jgi:hypothetical protein